MRVAMGDLTYIQSLGLPAFSSGFPGMPVYSGGLAGLAQSVVPQGPVLPDVSAYYQAGVAAGGGGTPGLDLSQGFPSSEAQAAFNAGYNAGGSPVTLAQISGATGTGPVSQTLPIVQGSVLSLSPTVILGAVAALATFIMLGRR